MNYEIFGYGVGGESNMKLFLELAKDLNLKKVAALYDSNSASFEHDSSSYPGFVLKQLRTEDIRDKINRCGPECPYGKNREGTFESDGTLKESQKVDFQNVMQDLENFFSS